MDNRPKYYLQKIESLPLEIRIKKVFSKVEDKGLNTISKISANAFDTEVTNSSIFLE